MTSSRDHQDHFCDLSVSVIPYIQRCPNFTEFKMTNYHGPNSPKTKSIFSKGVHIDFVCVCVCVLLEQSSVCGHGLDFHRLYY